MTPTRCTRGNNCAGGDGPGCCQRQPAACHCGQPVDVGCDPFGNPTFHRGMCARCDAVRCDVDPGGCTPLAERGARMTADTLRRAATLMRERADAAYRSPWTAGPDWVLDGEHGADEGPMAHINGGVYRNVRNTAEHIASWHPAVALAVADWLDGVADRSSIFRDAGFTIGQEAVAPALAVARAYLGEDA